MDSEGVRQSIDGVKEIKLDKEAERALDYVYKNQF